MKNTWGDPADVKELDKLFDMMRDFSTRNDAPTFLGEYGINANRDPGKRTRWLTAVTNAALARKMVPVLWDTGNDVSRHSPDAASEALTSMLRNVVRVPGPTSAPSAPER